MYSRSLIIGGSTALASAVLALAGTSRSRCQRGPEDLSDCSPKSQRAASVCDAARGAVTADAGPDAGEVHELGGLCRLRLQRKYSMVKSSFIQPTLTCDKTAKGYQVTVFWDGIDGFANGTVEQGGTEGYCHNGKGPFYDTWWEQYPKNDIQDVGTTVHAGDRIGRVRGAERHRVHR